MGDSVLAKRYEEAGKAMQVGPASAMADKIDAEIAAAAEKDVPRNDPRVVEAEKIAKALREVDGLRVRLAAREQRLTGGGAPQAKSQASNLKGAVPVRA